MTYSPIRAGWNIARFFVLVGVLLPPYALFLALAPKKRHHIARIFFRGCVALTGLRLNVQGGPAEGMAIYAANHSSYLDIPVLGAVLPRGVFVAKSEVADWPLFGFLARLSRSIFISRKAGDINAQCEKLSQRINRGAGLILFPEGTSTDGSHVKAFKSSLFACLDGVARETWVQPVSIAYTRRKDGGLLSQHQREMFTWFGDMTLAPHLLNVFGIQGCEVRVVFHEPLPAGAFENRKALTYACWQTVSDQVREDIGAPPLMENVTDVTDDPAPALAQ